MRGVANMPKVKSSRDEVLNHNLRMITEDRQRARELFLLILFEQGFGEVCIFPYSVLSAEVREYGMVVEDVLPYLIRKGFVEEVSEERYSNPVYPGPAFALTHEGLIEAEQLVAKRLGKQKEEVITKENVQTVIQHFNAPVGSVQTGNKSKAYVSQEIGLNVNELLPLISQLRREIERSDLSDKDDALEVIDALSEEVQKDEPRKGRLKAFLRQIGEFTSGTASNVIANIISKQIGLD